MSAAWKEAGRSGVSAGKELIRAAKDIHDACTEPGSQSDITHGAPGGSEAGVRARSARGDLPTLPASAACPLARAARSSVSVSVSCQVFDQSHA